MKIIRLFVSVFLMVAMAGILLPSANGGEFDKETRFICSQPVQVGGAVLQPGAYWFKVDDLSTPRLVIVIRDEDRTHVVARVNAIATYRAKPEGQTVFEYWDARSGQTAALRTWFYPGDLSGFEFVLNP